VRPGWYLVLTARLRRVEANMQAPVRRGVICAQSATHTLRINFIYLETGEKDVWHEDRLHGNLFEDTPKLGIGLTSTWPPDQFLTEPLDDVGEKQNLNSKYILSGPQRTLLKTGIVKNRRARNNCILEKRDKLPERLQHLAEDVALLHFRSLFSDSKWESGALPKEERVESTSNMHQQLLAADSLDDISDTEVEQSISEDYDTPFESPTELWESILDIQLRTQAVRQSVFFHGNPVFSKETQFGFEIGNVLRMIRPDSYESYFDQQWDDDHDVVGGGLIWGIILAFVGQSASQLDSERQQLSELFDRLLELQEERQKEAERMPNSDELENAQYEQVTKDAVKETGIKPIPLILREIEYHCYRHYESLDNPEMKQAAAKTVVERIADNTPLRKIDDLARSIEDDLRVIRNQGGSDVESVQLVLEPIWQSYRQHQGIVEENETDVMLENVTSAAIGNTVDKSKHGVSTVLNRVSAEEGSSCWTNELVVDRQDSGQRGTRWDLTPYGSLLCYTEFEYGGDVDWIYHYSVGPEELSMQERKLILDAVDDVIGIE
jgi:hypothetical protein